MTEAELQAWASIHLDAERDNAPRRSARPGCPGAMAFTVLFPVRQVVGRPGQVVPDPCRPIRALPGVLTWSPPA